VKHQAPLKLDERRIQQIVQEFWARRPGYVPNWQPPEKSADAALAWIFGRYLEAILQRLNQAPEKNKLAFLDLLGIDLIAARPARVPVVFQLSNDAPDSRAPAGTSVVAPPPPESTAQIVFETEKEVGLSTAQLQEVVSLWPGRDQYIDHSAAAAAGDPFWPFQQRQLEDTPHHIYIAHDTLLALTGQVRLNLEFELTQTSSEHLDIVWEYWDGKVWRGFAAMQPICAEEDTELLDGTDGFRRSGRFLLRSECAEAEKTMVDGVEAFWIRGRLREPLPPDPAQILPLVETVKLATEIARPIQLPPADKLADVFAQIKAPGTPFAAVMRAVVAEEPEAPAASAAAIIGLEPDQTFFNAEALDTSQTFFPLGQMPKPGDAFYFTSEEIFSKPGARATVYLERAETAADRLNGKVDGSGSAAGPPNGNGGGSQAGDRKISLGPDLRWEYWNGRRWQPLAVISKSGSGTADFRSQGVFEFTVQEDMEPTTVNDQEARWVRARLVSGGYGFVETVQWDTGNGTGEFSYVVTQPPAISVFRLGYIWNHGPFYPERVLTYNDFQYQDHTDDAQWPGQTFQAFHLLSDVTPALYLGFDKPLPIDRVNLFFDIDEQPGDTRGPALRWDYWDGFNWRPLTVDDETNNLRVPGMLSFIGPSDSRPRARFNASLHWIRGRLKEDGPPGTPAIQRVYLNAVWASQQQTLIDEPLGISSGQPDQVFVFRQVPVLPGQQIEVRELSGARANVEWRLLALEVLGDDYSIIQELESMLRQEGTQTDFQKGDLRLRRDRNKRVAEVWVRWQPQPHLYFSSPNDRHYVLTSSTGRLSFGDGEQGRIPPPGAAILARRYVTGGGRAGNVAANTISQILGAIGGVEAVFNPKPAEGGADAETLPAVAQRGPYTLRHRGRALAPQDYETMALEASPAVAVARALPTRDEGGRTRPGWVTLTIIPHSAEARPWPSFGLRQQVQRYIAERAPADLAAANRILVTGPVYQEVDVAATVVPVDPAQAGLVERAVRQAVMGFFHPLYGGPERRGWAPGRDVFLSDVASVLERVDGVDYVKEFSLLARGAPQPERVRIMGGCIAVAGQVSIQMVADA
jgi:uncharacterized phage protein gp47/JayE